MPPPSASGKARRERDRHGQRRSTAARGCRAACTSGRAPARHSTVVKGAAERFGAPPECVDLGVEPLEIAITASSQLRRQSCAPPRRARQRRCIVSAARVMRHDHMVRPRGAQSRRHLQRRSHPADRGQSRAAAAQRRPRLPTTGRRARRAAARRLESCMNAQRDALLRRSPLSIV